MTSELIATGRRLREEIGRRVFGLETEIDLLLTAILAGRHVLVEGVPGLGKTLLVKCLAAVMGGGFRRIQFTPDLLPADILGGYVYDGRDGSFHLRKGPIFANVVLADEINRAPAKTQSALLEVMEERQVTIEGETLAVPAPFFVFATQNPIEHEGVYPLPQAQLDRFAMRLVLTPPDVETEVRILGAYRTPPVPVERVASPEEIGALQRAAAGVTVSDEVIRMIADLAGKSRSHDAVLLGLSPRFGVDVVHLARARAFLAARSHVTPDDVKALVVPAGNHRMAVTPQAEIAGVTPHRVLLEVVDATRLF